MADIDAFQDEVAANVSLPVASQLPFITIGLAGETGEFAEKVKKHLRGDYDLTPEKRAELAQELGDILWHIARAASLIDYKLSDVLALNAAKRASRRDRNLVRGSGDNR